MVWWFTKVAREKECTWTQSQVIGNWVLALMMKIHQANVKRKTEMTRSSAILMNWRRNMDSQHTHWCNIVYGPSYWVGPGVFSSTSEAPSQSTMFVRAGTGGAQKRKSHIVLRLPHRKPMQMLYAVGWSQQPQAIWIIVWCWICFWAWSNHEHIKEVK